MQLRVFGPEGEPTVVAASADSEEGEYTGEFIPTKEGTHRVEAEASLGGKALGKDRGSFTAAFAYGETDDGLPRLDLLKQIAENSKGEYFSINDWNDKALGENRRQARNHRAVADWSSSAKPGSGARSGHLPSSWRCSASNGG